MQAASGNGKGGDIDLVAYAGSLANSGTIHIPTNRTIHASGSSGANGNVTIVAGGNVPLAIELGAINTGNGNTGTGSVTLSTSTPNDPVSGINVSKLSVGFGSVPAAAFLGGTVQSAATINVPGAINLNNGNFTALTGASATFRPIANSNLLEIRSLGDIFLCTGQFNNSKRAITHRQARHSI